MTGILVMGQSVERGWPIVVYVSGLRQCHFNESHELGVLCQSCIHNTVMHRRTSHVRRSYYTALYVVACPFICKSAVIHQNRCFQKRRLLTAWCYAIARYMLWSCVHSSVWPFVRHNPILYQWLKKDDAVR